MITDEDYHLIFKYIMATNPDIQAWIDEYTGIYSFYKLEGRHLKAPELLRVLIVEDLTKLEIPENMSKDTHEKAVKALRSVDIESTLLKIKLGV